MAERRFCSPWGEKEREGLVTVGSELKHIFSFYRNSTANPSDSLICEYSVQRSAVLPVRRMEASRLCFHVPLIHLCKPTCCEIIFWDPFERPTFHQTDNCKFCVQVCTTVRKDRISLNVLVLDACAWCFLMERGMNGHI